MKDDLLKNIEENNSLEPNVQMDYSQKITQIFNSLKHSKRDGPVGNISDLISEGKKLFSED